MTSLFYGVNWCQFYPNQWILFYFHGSLKVKIVDIKGFVRVGLPCYSMEKFSKR
mgnify:CR=1 FL=1